MRAADNQPRLAGFVRNDSDFGVIRAECLFTAFLVEHNIPLSVSDHAGPLFRKMFPKCEEAKRYASGRTKTTAIVREMAANAETPLLDALKHQVFSIAVDGSNNRDTQLYPIVATYFVRETSRVESRLLCLGAIQGEATGQKIGNLILDEMKSRNLPLENLLAMSSDNANVMVGRKNSVATVLREAQPALIGVGCPCHLINLAAQKGASCLPVKVDEALVDIFFYLEKSSKRKDRLKEFQRMHDVEVRKMIKHSPTRWLSLGKCLKRLLDQWKPLLSYFLSETKKSNKQSLFLESYHIPKTSAQTPQNPVPNPKSAASVPNTAAGPRKTTNADGLLLKRKGVNSAPQAKKLRLQTAESSESSHVTREERIFFFLSSELSRACCLFLQTVVPLFEKTNCLLQEQAPQIHVLRGLLNRLLEDLLTRFVRPGVLKECHSLVEIAYSVAENQKADEDLVIGSVTYSVVEKLSTSEKEQFFFCVRLYFSAACDYIRHKFPLEDVNLKMAEVAQVRSLETASFSSVRHFIAAFPTILPQESGESREEAMDALEVEFVNLQAYKVPPEILDEPRCDVQWVKLGNIRAVDRSLRFHRISRVMLGILSIPHSNAECERIFSTVNKTRTEFRSSVCEKTLESLLMVKGHQSGTCFEQTYTEKFLKQAKSATAKSLQK